MHVINNEPQFWFLLRAGDDLYLDLRVQASFAEYTALIRLSAEEKAEYAVSGHAYMIALAERLNYHVESHRSRNEYAAHGKRSHEAIMAWIAANPDAPR
ncbi:MAG: hypothetical protein H7Y38_11530 [Armatimonadetes bacterium]|nr:hypothetical protein [Armatimonadota bacterium]